MAKPKLNIVSFTRPAGMAGRGKLVRDHLTDRYFKRIKNKAKIKMYRDDESYVFVLSLPSEYNGIKYAEDLYYDVIVEFHTNDKNDLASNNIANYEMRVFSNCPSFTYTFDFTYSRIDALYKKIDKKMWNKEAIRKRPSKTNPLGMLGIEKSLVYAILHIESLTHLKKENIAAQLVPDITKFPGKELDDLMSQDDKLKEIHGIKRIPKKKKKPNSANPNKKGQTIRVNGKEIGETTTYDRSTSNLKSTNMKANTRTNMSTKSDTNSKSNRKSSTKTTMKKKVLSGVFSTKRKKSQ